MLLRNKKIISGIPFRVQYVQLSNMALVSDLPSAQTSSATPVSMYDQLMVKRDKI